MAQTLGGAVSDEAAGTPAADRDVPLWCAVGDRSTCRCATWLVDALALLANAILAAAIRRATAMECFVLRLVGRENVKAGKLRLMLLPLGGSNATASALL
jgi:hypothetical protein